LKRPLLLIGVRTEDNNATCYQKERSADTEATLTRTCRTYNEQNNIEIKNTLAAQLLRNITISGEEHFTLSINQSIYLQKAGCQ